MTKSKLRGVLGSQNRTSGGSWGRKAETQASFGVDLGPILFLVCTDSKEHKTHRNKEHHREKTFKNNEQISEKKTENKIQKIVVMPGGYWMAGPALDPEERERRAGSFEGSRPGPGLSSVGNLST